MSGSLTGVPVGWAQAKLGEIGEYLNGRAFKKSEWSTRGRMIIRIQDLTETGDAPNYFEGQVQPRYEVRRGDLLISWAATLGAYIWRGPEAVLNQHIFKVESRIDKDFHYYLVTAILDDLYRQAHGSGMVHITKGRFEETPVHLPPLAEQRRILAAIEEHFSDLDAAVAALDRVRATLPRYRAAVLKAACEGRLVETEAEVARKTSTGYETGLSLLERIHAERGGKQGQSSNRATVSLPAGWVSTTLGDLAEVGTGSTPRRSSLEYYEGGSIPWVTSGALNNEYVREPSELVTDKAVRAHRLRLYPAGTLLVAMYGEGKTRGKCSELLIDSTINQAIAAIQLKGAAESCRAYVKVCLLAQYESMRGIASGGVQPNLNLSLVGSIPMQLPPLAEQHRIVAEVDRRLSLADAAERAVEAGLAKAKRLRQAILKRGFEGKLVPQDPNDEPASMLLERIRGGRAAAAPSAAKTRTKRLKPA